MGDAETETTAMSRSDRGGLEAPGEQSRGAIPAAWRPALERYRRTGHRPGMCLDLVLSDVEQREEAPVVLDVGCGEGFDNSRRAQEQLARKSARYIGLDPDPAVEVSPWVSQLHRCMLEEAPIPRESVDVIVSAFVLEHVADPGQFLNRAHEILRPEGVLWAFTVDARHPFSAISTWMEKLRVKDAFLRVVRRGQEEKSYKNFPTLYRMNTPARIRSLTHGFSQCTVTPTLHRIGQFDYYFPGWLKLPFRLLDRMVIAAGLPGPILIIRLQK
ncbi:MAG: class I SAM-dependent methyltransferase [Myxococcota bacterium]